MGKDLSLVKARKVPHKPRGPAKTCLICKAQLEDLYELCNHLNLEHLSYRRHTCADCDFFNIGSAEMAAHARETDHNIVVNFMKRDVDKEELLKFMLKRAVEEPQVLAINQVEEEPMEETESIRSSSLLITEFLEEMDENGTEENANAMEADDDNAALIQCHYPGCGFKSKIDGEEKLSAIKKRHVEAFHCGEMDLLCPVAGCSRTKKFPHMRTLNTHICIKHDGVRNLSNEDRTNHNKLKTEVKENLQIKLSVCFPEED